MPDAGSHRMLTDPQRRLVYKWEDGFRSFYERTTTREMLRPLIRRAAKLYGIQPPTVVFLTRRACKGIKIQSDYDPSTHTITLGWKDCNHAIAMHEVAHAIVEQVFDGRDVQDHGPAFLGIYLYLLVWAKVAPRVALESSAKAVGLSWLRVLP